ncbi:MAG: TonB-dependent receptor, partial [Ignavibacteriae bacterium]|nr:TonB-dependent receptor [Ignavibacteriota bacterium]
RMIARIAMLFSLVAVVLVNQSLSQDATNGKIIGSVIDSETGEPIIGANVFLEETFFGGATDIEGKFSISVPPGSYALIVSVVSYAKQRITDVEVQAGQVVKIDITLVPASVELNEVVVTAKLMENREATTLIVRQRAVAVSDAISTEMIAQAGSSNAADAMTKVTGASVVGGKYVYIRGLGERYSNTHLNGSELPSADPDKKSFQMDLLPTNILDNIVTIKSFTPDKPGNFSGGIVDIGTASYPEKFTLKFSTSQSYNATTSWNSNFLTYKGGAQDWLGFDDGTRRLPDVLNDPNLSIPNVQAARSNPELAAQLDLLSKSFNPQMSAVRSTAPINQKYSLSLGDQTSLFGGSLGVLGSMSYARDYSFYENGTVGRWKLTGHVDQTDALAKLMELSDTKGTDEAQWGGLFTLNYKAGQNHEFGGNYVHTQSGESVSRYMVGRWPEQLFGENEFFETRVLQYTERNLNSYQLRGKHFFNSFLNTTIEWSATKSRSLQDEPDARFFSDNYAHQTIAGNDTTVYSVAPGLYPRPARYFRNLTEDNSVLTLELSIPVQQWVGLPGKMKFGTSFNEKDREFTERRFEYWQATGTRYNGDPESFFSNSNIGIIGYDSVTNRYIFGNYIANPADARGGDYDGYEKVIAYFGMAEIPLFSTFRIIAGARYEETRMNVSGKDTVGKLNDHDLLPSVNMVYQLSDNMNLRASYGKTLARPNFREKAPYASYSFAGDFTFLGNINLKRTLIHNYDLRWEWFARPGEIYAVSAFYKNFKNPIERVINVQYASEGGEVLFDNVDRARVYGLEFELRNRLDILHDMLSNLTAGMNLTLIRSEVDIPEGELLVTRAVDPNASAVRPLQGQSPYLLNAYLAYDNFASGTSVAAFFNTFGDRLAEVSLGGTPDVYEESRPSLDLNASQKIFDHWTIRGSVKNLLNSKYRLSHTYKGSEYVRAEYSTGVTFSVGVSYSID